MHVHMTMFWTIVLGILGSIAGGAISHIFSRPKNGRFHPRRPHILHNRRHTVLYICYKLNVHFPAVNPF
jgi:hypothetical protein